MVRAPTVVIASMILLSACGPRPDAAATAETAAPGNPVEGAWRVTAEVAPDGTPNASPQPSLYIFSPPYYSIARVNGTEARPLWPDGATRADLSDAQVRATFNPYTSNSGEFELKGDTLVIRPMVALSPNFMSGGADTVTFQVNGDTLVFEDVAVASSALSQLRTTLIRLR